MLSVQTNLFFIQPIWQQLISIISNTTFFKFLMFFTLTVYKPAAAISIICQHGVTFRHQQFMQCSTDAEMDSIQFPRPTRQRTSFVLAACDPRSRIIEFSCWSCALLFRHHLWLYQFMQCLTDAVKGSTSLIQHGNRQALALLPAIHDRQLMLL